MASLKAHSAASSFSLTSFSFWPRLKGSAIPVRTPSLHSNRVAVSAPLQGLKLKHVHVNRPPSSVAPSEDDHDDETLPHFHSGKDRCEWARGGEEGREPNHGGVGVESREHNTRRAVNVRSKEEEERHVISESRCCLDAKDASRPPVRVRPLARSPHFDVRFVLRPGLSDLFAYICGVTE